MSLTCTLQNTEDVYLILPQKHPCFTESYYDHTSSISATILMMISVLIYKFYLIEPIAFYHYKISKKTTLQFVQKKKRHTPQLSISVPLKCTLQNIANFYLIVPQERPNFNISTFLTIHRQYL